MGPNTTHSIDGYSTSTIDLLSTYDTHRHGIRGERAGAWLAEALTWAHAMWPSGGGGGGGGGGGSSSSSSSTTRAQMEAPVGCVVQSPAVAVA